MKNKPKLKYVLFVFCGIFGILTSLAYGQIVNLSNLPHTPSNHPWIVTFDNKVMVVWREEKGYSGSDYNTYYTIKTGNTWSQPKAAYSTGEVSKNPYIDIGPNGTIHLVWADGNSTGREVYYGKYKNGAWQGSREKIFSSPYNSNWIRIGIYDNNDLNVVWASAMFSGISEWWRVRNTWKTSGSSWNQNGVFLSKNATWSGDWDLAMHPDIFCKGNKAYVVYHEGSHDSKTIYFTEREGTGSWSYPVDITPNRGMFSWPGIVVDSDDTVHVITSATGGKVYYTNRRGGTWSDIKGINQVRHSRGFVTLDIDKNDTLHAVYQGGTYIYYNVANKLGIWGTEKKISNGKSDMYPCIRADNQGYVHIAWCEDDEDYDGDVLYTMIPAMDPPEVDSPIAQFTHTPESGKPPLKVAFDASDSSDPDGTIISYHWNFGDGSTGTGQKINHTFNSKGIYVITLTVTDNHGLTGTAQGYVYVTNPPVADFTMNPAIGVAPLTVSFDASSSYDPDGTIVQYNWDFGDDVTGHGKTVSHLFEGAGDYTVTLEVVDDYGADATKSKLLKVLLIHPPNNVQSTFKINRNLFSIEYFFETTWEANPLNVQHGINVVSYKIYRRVKGTQTYTGLAVVGSDTFVFNDRRLEKSDENRYEYGITAVDDSGNESMLEGLPGPLTFTILDKKKNSDKKR